VGLPVFVSGLRVDTWRENSGMAVSRLGVDDVFGRVDRTSRTEGRRQGADVGGRRTEYREHPASGIWSLASNSNLWGLNMFGTNPTSYFQLGAGSFHRFQLGWDDEPRNHSAKPDEGRSGA